MRPTRRARVELSAIANAVLKGFGFAGAAGLVTRMGQRRTASAACAHRPTPAPVRDGQGNPVPSTLQATGDEAIGVGKRGEIAALQHGRCWPVCDLPGCPR
jgi:hypothetical protein